jgi:diguanylate cyclase (GGDEF)-like protein
MLRKALRVLDNVRFHVSEPAATPDDAAGASSAPRLLALADGPGEGDARAASLLGSYRRLADVFHDILAEQSLDALLDRIADTLSELVPYDTLTIYEADVQPGELVPVLARDQWADKIMDDTVRIGEGITGWAAQHREAVLVNQAHLDPRMKPVPGTPPDEPEALMCIPLIARGAIKGTLNLYRLGESASFSEVDEFEVAKRFGDAAALALDNAQIRARLERQAQTDSLTGLYNHRAFHERLRGELQRASRSHESVALLMLDIDDFKRVNDVYGHGTGDEVLRSLAATLRGTVRGSDVVCRLGGEEFAVILPACDEALAQRLAERVTEALSTFEFDVAGRITISVGLAHGPEHAMNPRELVACAEAAMMTAKARGKNQIVAFGDGAAERPDAPSSARDVRSIAHLKMLQSLSGKLNRLNDVREIGMVIANELRSLIDYHNCRVFVVDGEDVVPVAFRGDLATSGKTTMDVLSCKVGEGITGRVAATGESLLIPDAARCEYARQVPGTDVIEESQINVPLRYGSRVIGVVGISKLGLNQFDDDDVRLLEVLAGTASVALENARLYEAERREAESAKALLEFGRELATAQGLDEIFERVAELSSAILGTSRTSVWLQDSATGELVPQAISGYTDEEGPRVLAWRFPRDVAERALAPAEPFAFASSELERFGGGKAMVRGQYVVAPFRADGGRLGCIVAAVPEEAGEFSDRELRLLAGIAYQAKLAITNAGNFESLEGTFFSTVEALANALEANDEYTSSHARWIRDMALEVGTSFGLDVPVLKRLELAALFHDIGKIGIPSAILAKPGRLTAEERAVMQTHPELGERIIAPIERLEDVRPVVRHCHEHWDGSGYPDRKQGDEIPLESRIILVCDAFHAMTTDRPYRKRLSVAEACRRLRQGAGTQFDPRVVDVCLRVLEERQTPAA